VVDTRMTEDGAAIRRRRECVRCGRRFTTFERIEEAAVFVLKRSGVREPFEREKIIAGIRAATKNRPVSDEDINSLVSEVEESLRYEGTEIPSELIGRKVLEALERVDHVSYVRFASVYKGFEDLDDFKREMGMLEKSTKPKRSEG